jgi:hypothetical protein
MTRVTSRHGTRAGLPNRRRWPVSTAADERFNRLSACQPQLSLPQRHAEPMPAAPRPLSAELYPTVKPSHRRCGGSLQASLTHIPTGQEAMQPI